MCVRHNLFQIVKTRKKIHLYTQIVCLFIYVTQDPNHAPTKEARMEY